MRLHAARPCPQRPSSGRSADRIGIPGEAMCRTGLVPLLAQKRSAALLFALAATIVALAGCSSGDQPIATRTPLPSVTTTPAPTSGPPTPTRSAPSPGHTAPPQTAAAPQGPSHDYVKCTDRVDYTGDPRANAEINAIGVQTGACPEPQPAADNHVECTAHLDYTGDPRANAEINAIGEQTGNCPEPQRPTPAPVTTSEAPTATTSSAPTVTTSNAPEPTTSTPPATSTVTPPTS